MWKLDTDNQKLHQWVPPMDKKHPEQYINSTGKKSWCGKDNDISQRDRNNNNYG